MPVEPIPCDDGGTGTPGACACAPSIAMSSLCRADGSTVLLVVRSPCTTCGATPGDPVVVGWIDPATGVLTPGPAPADAGPCDTPGCVETICRQLCDDTTGDGAADTTYSELWCIRADGSAEVVLTYQDDPSTPYTPVSPVDCTYGCPESETVMLCDDTGPFLRRYTFLAGTATYEDVALDGQTPHVVIGTPGVCPAAPDCASPTTPTATVGLCLADGTPIAVLITRDCDGITTQAGWINLTTGQFSAGAPPAGAAACGDGSAFELAGILCDTDPATGEVLGLALVEYAYNPDGSLAGVSLVNPADGTPYTLQGELLNCPTGQAQPDPDLIVLCDVQTDGTATRFVRNYRRDQNTLITGFTDYRLDGTPYTPTGTVTTCEPEPAEPCGDTETLPLCDNQLDGITVPFLRHLTYDCEGAVTGSADTALDGITPYAITGTLGQCPPCPVAFSTECTALVENQWSYDNTGGFNGEASNCGSVQGPVTSNGRPSFGCGGSFEITSWIVDGVELVTVPVPFAGGGCGDTSGTGMHDHWAQVLTQLDPAATWEAAVNASCAWYVHTLDAPDDTVYGTMVVRDAVTPSLVWTLGPNHTEAQTLFTKVFTQECDGTVSVSWLDAQGVPTTAPVGDLQPCGGGDGASVFHGEFQLCDVQADGTPAPFIRKFIQNPAGQVITVLSLDLDGNPYTPTGTVGVCSPELEPCRNASTLLLCDLPTDGTPAPTITDTPGGPYYPYTTGVPTSGAQTLWDGGTLTLPDAAGPQPGTGGTVRTAAAILQAPRPVCDAGTAHVTVRVDVTQLGPDNGCRITGFLGLYNGPGDANRVALALAPPDTPAGWSGTLTVEADVPAADLAAGNIAVVVAFDAYDDSGATCPPPRRTGWQLAEFDATVVYDQTGCAAQFLRSITTDCETGAVVSVTDTTLDGTPYTVTGEAGQCTAAGGACCPEQPCPAHTVIEACRCDDTDADGLPDVGYVELLAVDCTGALTSLGTYTDGLTGPYTPVAPVDCDTLDAAEGADPAFGVQARRRELAAGQSWSAAAWPTLQSVTAVAHGGTGTVTTADGTSTLHTGEAATWSVARDADALLTGPLTIAADSGTVTVSYTIGVTL